jgi:hypothetical protein
MIVMHEKPSAGHLTCLLSDALAKNRELQEALECQRCSDTLRGALHGQSVEHLERNQLPAPQTNWMCERDDGIPVAGGMSACRRVDSTEGELGMHGGEATGRRPWKQELTTVAMSRPGNIYKLPHIFTYTPLYWIAINNRDPNIFISTPMIYSWPPNRDPNYFQKHPYFKPDPPPSVPSARRRPPIQKELRGGQSLQWRFQLPIL